MNNEILNITSSWLSLALPIISPLCDTISGVQTFADKIISEKLLYVLHNQDSDFDDWLKISEKFNEDSKSYHKMVKQLIYYINAINETDMLHAYSNLLRAYKCGLICKNDFFRLSFCLTKLLTEDAHYLSKNINKTRIEENIYCLSLSANNLMFNQSQGFAESEADMGKNYYCFTTLGIMLDKYALSYGDENKYSYGEKETGLANQKITFYSKN